MVVVVVVVFLVGGICQAFSIFQASGRMDVT